ncbi:MAG: hypothetical protein IIB63_06015 [Proteobacteria bacterium]|nr:hypothetical protein [Pseudomonadota bacterium]
MKFPRTIRLDPSDVKVFPLAAEPGEWAVPGTFAFADADPQSLSRKEQLAFKSGWLGTGSFGRSTMVQVVDITAEQYDEVVRLIADHLVSEYGAPDRDAAMTAARDEAADAAGLCDHPVNTLLAIEREFTDDGISERVRAITPEPAGAHTRVWEIVEDED